MDFNRLKLRLLASLSGKKTDQHINSGLNGHKSDAVTKIKAV
jgi:hypothetical protein